MESNPHSELLTSAAVRNLFTRCQREIRKPIRYVTIYFQDRSSAALLRCKNRAEISDPFVNRGPIPYGFCVGAQAIRYSVDIALVGEYHGGDASISPGSSMMSKNRTFRTASCLARYFVWANAGQAESI